MDAALSQMGNLPVLLQKFILAGNQTAVVQEEKFEKFAILLSGVSDNSAKAALSMSSLTKAQRENVLEMAKGLKTGELFNSTLFDEKMGLSGLSEETRDLILSQSTMLNDAGEFAITFTNVAKAALQNSAAFKALSAEEQKKVLADFESTVSSQQNAAAMKTQAAQAKLTGTALNLVKSAVLSIGVALVSAGIQKGITLFKEWAFSSDELRGKLQQEANEAANVASAAENAADSVKDLAKQYEALGDSADWDTSQTEKAQELQQSIEKSLQNQNEIISTKIESVDLVNGKYEEQLQILKDITLEEAKQAREKADEEKVAAEQQLLNQYGALDVPTVRIRYPSQKDIGMEQFLEENGLISGTDSGENAVDDILIGDFDLNSAEGVIQYYYALDEAVKALVKTYDSSDLAESKLYKALTGARDAVKPAVEAYENAVNRIDGINKKIIDSAIAVDSELSELLTNFGEIVGDPAKAAEAILSGNYSQLIDEAKKQVEEAGNAMTGNIDNLNRDYIIWDDAAWQKFGSRMESLGYSFEDLEGEYSSILGTIGTYGEDGGEGIALLFSPMLETENGLVPLTQEEIDSYLESLVRVARSAITTEGGKRYGQTLEEAILGIDKNGLLDKNGNVISTQLDDGSTYAIKGLIGAVGTDAQIPALEKTEAAMHDAQTAWMDIAATIDGEAQEKLNQFCDTLQNELGISSEAAEAAIVSMLNSISSAVEEETVAVGYSAEKFDELGKKIDSVQAAYSAITSAIREYNQHGYLSVDTLQSLLEIDNKYLASLIDENGQLSLNMSTMQQVTEARLNDAKASAIEEAMAQLNAIANGQEISTASGAAQALTNKGAAVDYLAGRYANLGAWAAYAAQAQSLADAYTQAAAKNQGAADTVMKGLNAKLGLIDATMKAVQGSAKGASNALGGFGSASGGAAGKSNQLTDALNKQKEALKAVQDELKSEQNRLKIYGQAAIKALDKQIEALNKKKKALEEANDEEDRALKLAELQEALARAQNSRNVRTYTSDQGFVWMADESAVQDAQNNLDDQNRSWAREDALAAVDAEIEKLNELKDKYNETMGLIGTSWEDYQTMLSAAAMFEAMTFEQMAGYHGTYANDVISNMKQLYDVEQQLIEVDRQLEEAQAGLSGGGGGGGAALADTLATLEQKYQDMALRIAAVGEANNALKEKEAELQKTIDDTSLSFGKRHEAQSQLAGVQREIADNEAELARLSAEYVQSLSTESEMSEESRNKQLDTLVALADQYGISYEEISGLLDEYIDKLDILTLTDEEKFGLINDTLQTFHDKAVEGFGAGKQGVEDFTGAIEEKFGPSLTALDQMIEKLEKVGEKAAAAALAVKNANGVPAGTAAKPKASGTPRFYASGTRGVNAIVDEAGREIVVRKNQGRYTTLEIGDGVIKNDWTNTLMSAAINPQRMISERVAAYFQKNKFGIVGGGSGQTVTVNVGGITMNEVNDAGTFSRIIEQSVGTVFAQAVSRSR